MRRAIYMILIGSCLGVQCSDETENSPLNLTARVEGTISAVGEFGIAAEKSRIQVSLLNGDQVVASALTDEDGKFDLAASTGTYRFLISKAGFGVASYPGFALLGGNEPRRINTSLLGISTAYFSGTSLALGPYLGSSLTFNTTVHHDAPSEPGSSPFGQRLIFFLSDNANVSKDNYLQYITVTAQNASQATPIQYSFYYSQNLFPSGTTVFIRAYGINISDSGARDLISNKLNFFSICTRPSEVVSIQIP